MNEEVQRLVGQLSGSSSVSSFRNKRSLIFPSFIRLMLGHEQCHAVIRAGSERTEDDRGRGRPKMPESYRRSSSKGGPLSGLNAAQSEDRTHIYTESGFEPGRIYEVTYTGQDPALAGLGPAGIRDYISYL